jgi:hypothetical protein
MYMVFFGGGILLLLRGFDWRGCGGKLAGQKNGRNAKGDVAIGVLELPAPGCDE